MKNTLKKELLARVLDLANLESKKSRFSEEEAIFLGRREIAHFHSSTEIDIRLTRSVIKKMGILESGDPRLLVERKGSDWVAVKFKKEADLGLVVSLIEAAVRANKK